MEKEDTSSFFLKKLKEWEDSLAPKPDPSWEASGRFDRVYEKQLIEEERALLDGPATSMISVIQEAAHAIEEKEGFSRLNKETYSGYGGTHKERKLEKLTKFDVEFLGLHGDRCYPKWEDAGVFVQKIESGKQISDLIKGFKITYQYLGIWLSFEAQKGKDGDLSVINWEIGSQSSGALKIDGSDFTPLAELLADKIAHKKYADFRSSGVDMGEGWSIN